MAFLRIFQWWYGGGFGWVLARIENSLKNVGKTLAIDVLAKTLFAPWKQIQTTGKVPIMQKILDNTISRLIGFLVRVFMLIVGGLWAIMVIIFGLFALISWFFVPFLVIILPILAINGVGV